VRLTKRVFRHAPKALFASVMAILAGAAVPAPSAAAAMPTATIPQLASDVSACAALRPDEVAAYAADLRDARVQTLRSPASPDFANHAVVRELILTTMPRFRVIGGSSHAMTAREYATYRAGELVADRGLYVSAAINSCRGQAARASVGRVPNFQSCGYPPCNVPHPVKTMYDSAGNYTDLYLNQQTGAYVSETSFSSKNAQTATGGIQAVSNTTWEPWVNGGKGGSATFPAVAQTTATPNASYVGNLPVPSSVPQSGWVVLPGSNIWADLGSNSVLVPVDSTGDNYYTVSGVANGGVQVHTYNGEGNVASSPIVYPATGSTYLNPSVGATAIEIAIYLSKIAGFYNVNNSPIILQDTMQWTTIWDPTIITDTSWSDYGGLLFGGGGGGGGGGCEVSRPGGAVPGGHRVAPLDASCGGDDW
jgi:hypothetical protein